MTNPHWPLFDLRIVTPRLELRYPSDDDLFALAGILAEGIHDPDTMPFAEPWTRAESPELERNGLRFWWSRRGDAAAGQLDTSLCGVRARRPGRRAGRVRQALRDHVRR